MSVGPFPSVRTVLVWRWGVATLVRIGGAGVVGWILWTYVPRLVIEFIARPMRGGTPFSWLDPSAALTGPAVMARDEFWAQLRLDAATIVACVACFFLAGWFARVVVRMPRPLERCPACGYSLKGLRGARCPECGLELPSDAGAGGGAPGSVRQATGSVERPPPRSGPGESPA